MVRSAGRRGGGASGTGDLKRKVIEAMSGKRVVFLDRDGTINVDRGYVHRAEDFEFVARAPEALKRLKQAGYCLAVVTNQSGIAHGLYQEGDMQRLHRHMADELGKRGVRIDAIAFCPHARGQQACGCRKPQTGMAKQVEEKVGAIDYGASWTVGDKAADLEFGKKLGTKTALIRSRYWQEDTLAGRPAVVVDNLYEAAREIAGT